MASRLLARLSALGLFKADANLSELGEADGPGGLIRACGLGLLDGGLSVALDVRGDELVGPLTALIGGTAQSLKVLDVRDRPEVVLAVSVGGKSAHLSGETVPRLADALNDLFTRDGSVKAVAVLGEAEEMWQLWCLDKRLLKGLSQETFFQPENRGALYR